MRLQLGGLRPLVRGTRTSLPVIALVVCLGAQARADGEVAVRGAYYKEDSTLVVQPMVDATLDTGRGGTIDTHFLVDSITSASAATGGSSEFTERRYEGGAGYTHRIGALTVGASGRYSIESDYTSLTGGARAALELAEKTTTLALALARSSDTITNNVAKSSGAIGTPSLRESLSSGLTSISVTQLLTPRLVGALTYDFMDAHGFQANIYRQVRGPVPGVREHHPDLRLRHAVHAGVRWFVAPSKTTVVGGYRIYADDWGIVAHTPEVRVIQEITDGLEVRLRGRYHTQTAANFYKDVYSTAELTDPDAYVSEDEKLSAHHTETVGLAVTVALRRFGVGGELGDTLVDLGGERIWQSTTFGPAWFVSAGLIVPVRY